MMEKRVKNLRTAILQDFHHRIAFAQSLFRFWKQAKDFLSFSLALPNHFPWFFVQQQ